MGNKTQQVVPALQEAITKIQQGNYQNNRSDLMRAIRDSNVSKQQLNKMISMLDNPITSGVLNRISPNLSDNLRGLGQEISNSFLETKKPITSTPQQVGFKALPLKKGK